MRAHLRAIPGVTGNGPCDELDEAVQGHGVHLGEVQAGRIDQRIVSASRWREEADLGERGHLLDVAAQSQPRGGSRGVRDHASHAANASRASTLDVPRAHIVHSLACRAQSRDLHFLSSRAQSRDLHFLSSRAQSRDLHSWLRARRDSTRRRRGRAAAQRRAARTSPGPPRPIPLHSRPQIHFLLLPLPRSASRPSLCASAWNHVAHRRVRVADPSIKNGGLKGIKADWRDARATTKTFWGAPREIRRGAPPKKQLFVHHFIRPDPFDRPFLMPAAVESAFPSTTSRSLMARWRDLSQTRSDPAVLPFRSASSVLRRLGRQ
jgi:hypothetical protein